MNTLTLSKIDMRTCGWTLSGLYLLLGYFTPLAFNSTGLVVYSLLMVMTSLVHIAGEKKRHGGLSAILFLFGLLILAFAVSYIFSPYGHSTGLRMTLFLLDATILIGILRVQDCGFEAKWFYNLSTIGLIAIFSIFIIRPTFFMDYGGAHKTIDDLSPLLWGAADKNRTALFVFLYFAYSVKHRKRIGIALSLAYPLFYLGRQYLIMVFLLVLFLLVASRLRMPELLSNLFNGKTYFIYFITSAVAVSLFSSFWVGVVMAGGVGEYKSGWNDSSNAVRMSSIQYVSEEMASDSSYIVYGLDSDIFKVLGISQDDTRRGQTYYVNGLYRLVQPHQEVLNTLLKEGILMTLSIYGLISCLLSTTVRDRFDRATVLAYLLGSLTLHEMFINQSLMLLLFVLCSRSKGGGLTAKTSSQKISLSVSLSNHMVVR